MFVNPVLDQHSGANHQNLFDNTKVHITLNEDKSYPLFAGGGAGYWKPSHGGFSTFWNTKVNVLDNLDANTPILLNGMTDGPFARVIGVTGNHFLEVSYEPLSHIEFINKPMECVPYLYTYQLKKRLNKLGHFKYIKTCTSDNYTP